VVVGTGSTVSFWAGVDVAAGKFWSPV